MINAHIWNKIYYLTLTTLLHYCINKCSFAPRRLHACGLRRALHSLTASL